MSSSSSSSALRRLIDSDSHHLPSPNYLSLCRDRTVDVTARQDSINWILKVHSHYRFAPLTAFLSVNYLDRFLSTRSLPQQHGRWPFQLLSVACLSLAAKMEEPNVPYIVDLQIFEPRFVFEPKTVQRMELLVMSSLNWRLRSVTPFDFLPHFISKLPASSPLDLHEASSDLVLKTIRVIDFLGFSPSTVAAAAVLCATGVSVESAAAEDQAGALFDERVNKESVRSCHQLMEEYLIDTCPSSCRHKAGSSAPPPSAPASPVGVLDAAACKSCDTRSENPGALIQAEPPHKRPRISPPENVQSP
ncbi:putative cyclin B3, G2/mitotic-specific [Rosa chinensis]|uniref:B-like cyclin n=1 Tax=Rosa chinensis TaxID=74649 RepID=A0A2P6PL43_ROSCH|nr:cyclin-D4-1 [Rosa chinensis]PRQ22654.1 putative cyclin B3, G2/mitotic-specific [Rosa chinensis]